VVRTYSSNDRLYSYWYVGTSTFAMSFRQLPTGDASPTDSKPKQQRANETPRCSERELLVAAASGNELDARTVLLAADGLDCWINDGSGNTALMWAACHGHASIVSNLLSVDVHPNVVHRRRNASFALILAACHGHTSIVSTLLSAGAYVDLSTEDGDTALLRAAHAGHESIVSALLSAGAHVDAMNTFGDTALISATSNGHVSIVSASFLPVQMWMPGIGVVILLSCGLHLVGTNRCCCPSSWMEAPMWMP
jgi:hypothetical protein